MIETDEQRRARFAKIYDRPAFWGSNESKSGCGSTVRVTKPLVDLLSILFYEYNIRSLVDAPCGDFNWMKAVAPSLDSYIGVDIVPRLIEDNRLKHPSYRFECLDIVRDSLPKADAVMVRDCLIHLPNDDAVAALSNLRRQGYKYLIATTFRDMTFNVELAGVWRPMNLEIEPYNLGKSADFIQEKTSKSFDKQLAIWRLT